MAGQVIKRGEKNWVVRIFMGRDGNGKRRYMNKTIRGTKKAADTYLNKTLTEISAGTFVESSPTTVEEYLQKWLETAAKPRLRDNTYKEYLGLIERYISRHSDVCGCLKCVLWRFRGSMRHSLRKSFLRSQFALRIRF